MSVRKLGGSLAGLVFVLAVVFGGMAVGDSTAEDTSAAAVQNTSLDWT
ncbi:hypothetical protein [Actinoplanes sp. NPDC049802]